MRKLLSIAVAAAALIGGAAKADIVYIDTFDLPKPAQTVNVDLLGSTVSIPSTASITTTLTTNPTPVIATSRKATITATTQTGPGEATLTVGSDLDFGTTRINVSNGTSVNSTTEVAWTIPANSFIYSAGAPVSLFFDVVSLDTTARAGVVYLTSGGTTYTLLTNQALTVGENNFGIADSVASLLSTAGGTLTLSFTGSPSFDIVLDTFGLTIPEPTSLALTGLALVGAGFAARRRKSA